MRYGACVWFMFMALAVPPPLSATAADSPDARATTAKQAKRQRQSSRPVTRPPPNAAVAGPDRTASQRAVCQSQCNLERMSCDQGRASAFRDRSDQLQAASSSCYLAVNACLARC